MGLYWHCFQCEHETPVPESPEARLCFAKCEKCGSDADRRNGGYTRELNALALAREAMELAEWGASDEGGARYCPVCECGKGHGHGKGCKLRAALEAVGHKPPTL